MKRPFHVPGYETFVGPGDKKRIMTFVKMGCFKSQDINETIPVSGQQLWVSVRTKRSMHLTFGNIYREWSGSS